MARSLWKGPFVPLSLMSSGNVSSSGASKVFARHALIIPDFVGKTFVVYNGKKWIRFTISEDMVGHKFGEFSWSRQQGAHKKK